jgi:hypothetical protein
MSIAVFHGIFAVTGLILLIMNIANLTSMGALNFALVLFILAALGGLGLFFGFYLRKKRLSSPIVGLHALFAVAGFMLVIVHAVPH